jgi:hypothetical protein
MSHQQYCYPDYLFHFGDKVFSLYAKLYAMFLTINKSGIWQISIFGYVKKLDRCVCENLTLSVNLWHKNAGFSKGFYKLQKRGLRAQGSGLRALNPINIQI